MVRGRTDKKINDLQTRHLVARDLGRYVGRVETQRKAKVGYRKTEARQCQTTACIYFIDPESEEFKDIMKNARRKLEVPMPAAMPCKTPREECTETCSVEKKCKTKYACIVEADKSTRKRMEGYLHNDHEDHSAGNGMNSLSHYNLVRKCIFMPQALKVPDAKAAVDIEWKKTRENTCMAPDESQKPKRGDR